MALLIIPISRLFVSLFVERQYHLQAGTILFSDEASFSLFQEKFSHFKRLLGLYNIRCCTICAIELGKKVLALE